MMDAQNLSKKQIESFAKQIGFDAYALEKMAHLQRILTMINNDPFLQPRLILKGGTALNLFYLNVPRLSVDLDFNYIGSAKKEVMLSERAEITRSLTEQAQMLGFEKDRFGHRHAGGKTIWRYQSIFGQRGSIEIDLNFMHRVPFGETTYKVSTLECFGFNKPIHIQNIHEIAAGKIMALQSRDKSRDIFDTAMLSDYSLNRETLRLYTVLYAAMDGKQTENFRDNITAPGKNEFRQQLRPLLKMDDIGRIKETEYLELLINKSNHLLNSLFPFKEHEKIFLTGVLNGSIKPELLTSDITLQSKILSHPGIGWHAYGKKAYIETLDQKAEISIF